MITRLMSQLTPAMRRGLQFYALDTAGQRLTEILGKRDPRAQTRQALLQRRLIYRVLRGVPPRYMLILTDLGRAVLARLDKEEKP